MKALPLGHFLLTLSLIHSLITTITITASGVSREDTACGLALDGVDDFASFSLGAQDAEKLSEGVTLMLWHRNKRKDKDGHFEQCLVSHSRDDHASDPIMKVQLTVESKLSITLRFSETRKVTCDVDMALQDERWYHTSVAISPTSDMEVHINGIQIKYYCVENKGEPNESFNTEHIFPDIPFTSEKPFVLGSSMPQDHGENFYKGNLADFKIFQRAMSSSDTFHMLTSYPFEYNERSLPITRTLLVDLPLRVNCSSGEALDVPDMVRLSQGSKYTVHSPGSSSMGNAYTSSVRNTVKIPVPDQHYVKSIDRIGVASRPLRNQGSTALVFPSERELRQQKNRVAMLHLAGTPRHEVLNLGDGVLSVMLTVAETKLAFIQYLREQGQHDNKAVLQHDFSPVLGDISSFVINGENALDQLCASLTRHFDVQMDENRIWRGYNEYAIRLEMLGHSIALILKNHGKEKNKQKLLAEKVRSDLACKTRGDCPTTAAEKPNPPLLKPLVGLIVPATSKGVSAHELNHLTLGASLLPSLYQTRSSGYNYYVYLTVNENDPIYSNSVLTHTIFDVAYSVAKEKYFASLNITEYDSLENPELVFPKIPHRVILVPDSMLPKRALSALFNIPTLIAAYTDNCDYFYVVNDDLLLKSYHWTEKLIEPLVNNPVFSGLGVSGGIDVSDSITPQIEFPFFSRTHVELFPWCGCNPWIFKNWWEDNWLTDIYLPFDSIFYRRDVVVENYIGLDVKVAVSGSKTGSADPSYTVTEGRRTPFFYMEEVEKARKRIVHLLEKHVEQASSRGDNMGSPPDKLVHEGSSGQLFSGDDLPEMLAFVQGFDDLILQEEAVKAESHGTSSSSTHESAINRQTLTALVTKTGYCDGIQERKPSLLTMPVAFHEYVLDPCDAHLSAPEHRNFVPEVHSVELPHTSYAGLLSDSEAEHENFISDDLSQFRKDLKDSTDVCRHYYLTLERYRKNKRVHRLDDFDDDVYQDWEACVHTVGFDKFFALKAMQKSELCKSKTQLTQSTNLPPPPRQFEYDSCRSTQSGIGTNRLKILILHNHAPLFTRYGSDKRLYHIAETLVGLGHEVLFGGSFVSDLETEDDHMRLHHIDAKLYSPLAIDSGDRNGIYADEFAFSAMLKKEKPDVVFMTLWFWNSPPATILYMDLVKRLAPAARIAVISDDAHTLREELLLSKDQSNSKNSVMSLLGGNKVEREESRANQDASLKAAQEFRNYKLIRTLEYLAYAKADVVLTITENDREKILRTKAGITSVTMPQIDRGRYARGPEPDRVKDFAAIMNPLPPEKIRLVRYALSPTEIVSNFGLKLRKGESGGTIEGAKRAHLSFVGNGANPTNIAAMRWFATDIFELIRHEIPGVQLFIIGADWDFMREEFPKFFNDETGHAIVLRGILNQEDLTKAVVTSKVFVSPISVSTGLNTKNLLALSRGLPLVTTPLGAEGLLYASNPDESDYDVINPDAPFVQATTAEAFAHKTVRLYNDNDLWRQVALSALRHARSSFGLSVQAHELEDALHYAFSSSRNESENQVPGDWGSRSTLINNVGE